MPFRGPRTPTSASRPTRIMIATITWPMTPSTERRTIVLCVIRPQRIRRICRRYSHAAGVAELVRRARLKIGWPSGRAGSSPAPGIAQPARERQGVAQGEVLAFEAQRQIAVLPDEHVAREPGR